MEPAPPSPRRHAAHNRPNGLKPRPDAHTRAWPTLDETHFFRCLCDRLGFPARADEAFDRPFVRRLLDIFGIGGPCDTGRAWWAIGRDLRSYVRDGISATQLQFKYPGLSASQAAFLLAIGKRSLESRVVAEENPADIPLSAGTSSR
jgi:hypothetical protein